MILPHMVPINLDPLCVCVLVCSSTRTTFEMVCDIVKQKKKKTKYNPMMRTWALGDLRQVPSPITFSVSLSLRLRSLHLRDPSQVLRLEVKEGGERNGAERPKKRRKKKTFRGGRKFGSKRRSQSWGDGRRNHWESNHVDVGKYRDRCKETETRRGKVAGEMGCIYILQLKVWLCSVSVHRETLSRSKTRIPAEREASVSRPAWILTIRPCEIYYQKHTGSLQWHHVATRLAQGLMLVVKSFPPLAPSPSCFGVSVFPACGAPEDGRCQR